MDGRGEKFQLPGGRATPGLRGPAHFSSFGLSRPLFLGPKLVMAQHCQVCVSKDRRRIELLKASGASIDELAARFNLHRDAIWRHWTKHVTDEEKAKYLAGPVKVKELLDKANIEDHSVIDYLGIVRTVLVDQFTRAADANAYTAIGNISGRLLECLRDIGKITGEIRQYSLNATTINNVNIFNSPDFANLQAGLIEVLAPFPEARVAVIRMLRNLEAGALPDPQFKTIEASPIKRIEDGDSAIKQ